MATTGKDIFDMAITLMGELDDSGKTDYADTQEYKNRAVNILNVLRGEVFQYSDTYQDAMDETGRRPVSTILESLDDYLDIDDVLAQTVLPYGLAAHLLLDENDAMAAFFQQRYEELLKKIGAKIPSSWESITDVYNATLEYGQFGRW